VARIFSFLFPVIFLIANLGQAAVLYFGGQQIIAGTLTMGEWQKFSLYLVLVFFPLGQLGFIISQMSQAAASANRVFEILDAPNEVTDKPGAPPLPPVQGAVDLRPRHLPLLWQHGAGAQRRQLQRRAGRDGGHSRRDGQRQEQRHQPDPALLRRHRRRTC
jgi:ABC-type multidrug transport system fused ATPase/permease subunit